VFGAAADTAGVTSFSLGLWGRDPVTGQQVVLTPEDGTYELIVGASSISMLVGMPFAKGIRGPTTGIPVPKPQVRFVDSFSVVGDTVVASPVRVPVVTWTKGAIEVSHQGVAIGSAYAGTTRIVAMMASGPMPSGPGNAGNFRRIDPAREGIDAHAFKPDYAGRLADQFNIAVDANGEVWLVPVRAGQHPNIRTRMTLDQVRFSYRL
jgi:hypothetical protein